MRNTVDQSKRQVVKNKSLRHLFRDHIWEEGMHPIAQIDNTQGTEQVLYLYTDHLMTNRLATDQTQAVVWRWEGEAFGNTAADEIAGFSVNLRFPGQYFDSESNLFYNHHRYYDPTLGRYITSDPIGLFGGINTYSYVYQNSVMYTDPDGKNPLLVIAAGYGLYKHWTRHDYNEVKSQSMLINEGVNPLPDSKSLWHQLNGATGNEKFVWGEDNQFEGIFDENGCPVTDPLNMGTYNYFNPTGSVFEQAMHGLVDIAPYMVFGNTPYDAATGFDDRWGALFK